MKFLLFKFDWFPYPFFGRITIINNYGLNNTYYSIISHLIISYPIISYLYRRESIEMFVLATYEY